MTKELTNMDKKVIEEKVDEILREIGFDSKNTRPDIVEIANFYNFEIRQYLEMPLTEDGFVYVSKDKKMRIIGINNDRSPSERRFIVAHEFAHYFLHGKDLELKDTFMHRENVKGKNQDENDADYFAACLLMPTESFLREYNRLKNSGYNENDIVIILENMFKTPTESIIRRIKEVNNEQ